MIDSVLATTRSSNGSGLSPIVGKIRSHENSKPYESRKYYGSPHQRFDGLETHGLRYLHRCIL